MYSNTNTANANTIHTIINVKLELHKKKQSNFNSNINKLI